jgi:hypothetical protein
MQDQYGLVPPTIKANYEREEMVDEQMAKAFSLYHALQAMDRRLDLVFVSERADPEYGVKPGRWHVVRKNDPPAPDSYMAIETPDGKYMEPHSGILRDLADRDLWKHGTPENDRRPSAFTDYSKDDGFAEELAHDLRAGARLPGDGGLYKKLWGKGKPKGLVGS